MLDLPPSLVTSSQLKTKEMLLTNSKISHGLAYFRPVARITAPRRRLHAIQHNHVATSLISVTFLFLLNTVVMELGSEYGPLQV